MRHILIAEDDPDILELLQAYLSEEGYETVPVSPWSFGDYLARILPLLCLGELCLVSVFTSRRERAVQVITQTAPVDPGRYALIRWGAVLAGTLALWLCVIVLAVGFYVSLFGWQEPMVCRRGRTAFISTAPSTKKLGTPLTQIQTQKEKRAGGGCRFKSYVRSQKGNPRNGAVSRISLCFHSNVYLKSDGI